jgi:hypothetical protein
LPVSTEERAGNLIEACVARGTAHLRTHVDIDLEAALRSSTACWRRASSIAAG